MSAKGLEVHRIAAHRSLNLNPNIIPPSLDIAKKRLFYGSDDGGYQHKHGYRYQSKPETILLNDFDHLLAALYAENNDVSVEFRQQCLTTADAVSSPPTTKLDKLKAIWEKVLPHRFLVILSGDIKTKTAGGEEYSASDMSDGERVIFYLIAQALLAKQDTLLIFDEPELHINKAILAKLWDQIESARPDCAFLYITHDIDFAASRHAATKYALRTYQKQPEERWDIELLPDADNIPDDIVAAIIGSRRPVLFVEGDDGSLDSSLYRRVYNDFTVIPVGSCDQVIRTVASFIARPELHRVGCAGIVDADGRTDTDIKYLETVGIYCLPVSEVENLLLLPNAFAAVANSLVFQELDTGKKFDELKIKIFSMAEDQVDEICLRYAKRRIDSEMKKIGLFASNIQDLEKEFRLAVDNVNAEKIFSEIKQKLTIIIEQKQYENILRYYDNKGLLAEMAKKLGLNQKALEEFIGRILRSDEFSLLQIALLNYLPTITPRPN